MGTNRISTVRLQSLYHSVAIDLSTCFQTQLIKMVRGGVVGYGALGWYLAKEVEEREGLELVWVWNRSPVADLPDHLILGDLSQCDKGDPDLIVEVAHPDVTREFGARFLEVRISMLFFLSNIRD